MEKAARAGVARPESESGFRGGLGALVGECKGQIRGSGLWTLWFMLTKQGLFYQHLGL